MDYVIAKVNKNEGKRSDKHKLILTDKTLYSIPDALDSAVEYNAETLIENCEWYKLTEFSTKTYCLPILTNDRDSTFYSALPIADSGCISYLCSCQNNGTHFYFQRIPKSHLATKKYICIGDSFEYKNNSKNITINEIPDALYDKTNDILYFKKLETITSIFKGIDDLYREATEQETEAFLANDFISLIDDFNAQKVKKANRKRIALAMNTLANFDPTQKEVVFDYIVDYCPQLSMQARTFIIASEADLELLSYGILQRFYTTADGREKRIANSIKSFNS
jgi:hypothetical protein